MKRLTTSILALTLATGTAAFAADDTATDDGAMKDGTHAELIRSRDITGGEVYTLNKADDEGWDAGHGYDTVGADWNEIGEIEDLVLSKDGKLIGIVAEVGGFLDIGDKHVMIPLEDARLVAVDDKTYGFVTKYSEEQLEKMESVDEAVWN